ncbi:unnamed protein product, partial [Tenebrio molitor]
MIKGYDILVLIHSLAVIMLTLAETSTPIDESLTPTPDRKMLIP